MTAFTQRDGRRGEDGFVVLPIASLKVDRTYQRRYDHAMVVTILQKNDGNFDMVWAGPILVNKRKTGGLYIIDGQHRVGMATEAKETEILAELLVGLSQQQEAELRVARHSRKSDNSLERFHARVASGDSVALQIVKIVRHNGAEIAEHHGAPASHIRAVSELERLYHLGELNLVLKFVRETFGDLDRRSSTSYMLHGVSWLFEHHDFEIDEPKLKRRLKAKGLRGIDSIARVISAGGGSMWKCYYRAMLEIYNNRAPDRERLLTRNH